MSLRPLDMQVVIGQMDRVGSNYLKAYTAPRKDQIYHANESEQRSRDIDHKVLDLPEEVSEYQESYVDPHDDESGRKQKSKYNKHPYREPKQEQDPLLVETDKGNIIDTWQ